MTDLDKDLFNLAMSDEALPLMDAVKKHIAENVEPITEEFFALDKEKTDRWSWHPRQLELLEGAKNAAKSNGLWNFFLPDNDYGSGLTNLDYEIHPEAYPFDTRKKVMVEVDLLPWIDAQAAARINPGGVEAGELKVNGARATVAAGDLEAAAAVVLLQDPAEIEQLKEAFEAIVAEEKKSAAM